MNIVSSILLAKRSDSSECTGDKYECQKPTDSSYTKTIVLAVVIPVAVVILVFSFIVLHIYRKNQREKLEDYDPEFVGGLDYYERKYYEPHMMTDQQQQQQQDPNRENYYNEAGTAESISDLHNLNVETGFQGTNGDRVNYNEMHDININTPSHTSNNIKNNNNNNNNYNNNI